MAFVGKHALAGPPLMRAGGGGPSLNLVFMLRELEAWDDRIPLEILSDRLRRLQVGLDDLSGQLHFDSAQYTRNLLHSSPHFEALVLCWESGQHSPIHDHHGSNCAVRVVHGVATEVRFARDAAGRLCAAGTTRMTTPTVTVSADADMHRISNEQPAGTNLVTLHIYSPPLRDMRVYDEPVWQPGMPA